jgi:hypothetical protein
LPGFAAANAAEREEYGVPVLTFLALGAAVKVAVTALAAFMVTLQGGLVQSPLQLEKVEVLLGVALKLTTFRFG